MTAESPLALPVGRLPHRQATRLVLPNLGRLRPVVLPLVTAALALAFWQAVAEALRIPAAILPTPTEIGAALWQSLPTLLVQALPTTRDAVLAFAFASALGIALAVVLTYLPLLRDTLYPNLIAFQLVPKVALAPLFVVWLGIGSEARVAFSTFVCFFPIVISASVGFAGAEASTLRLCRSLTASQWQSFLWVRFPFALPAIFSGMKVAMTMAVIGVIIGEFISSKEGLGFYILNAGARMQTAEIFAALFGLCAIGAALYGAVALAEAAVRRSYGRR